jgi:acyl-CoA thioesterase II
MHFEQLIDSTIESVLSAKHSVCISSNWSQGRTVYGGLSAALLYTAIKHQTSDDRVLRSYNTSFIGPLIVEEPIRFETEVLRQGKNVTQVSGRIIQNNKVCVQSQACFGVDRQSKIVVANKDTHAMELPKKAKFLPKIPKITPKFLNNIDLAMIDGGLPFTGRKKSHVHGWMRFKNSTSQITDAHIIALIDAWPPTVLQMLRWPSPVSTMSWNIEFIHPHHPIAPTDWLAYQAKTRQAASGYAHTEANIWDQQGELIAVSRQAVTVFD